MSQSNAAAIKRRVGNQSTVLPGKTNNAPVNTAPVVQPQGLTLPQIINIMDKRLVALETFMKDSSQSATLPNTSANQSDENSITNIIDEFNNRFEFLAGELDTLKDIILKLQSFTMEVNKTLLDERVHIFSEVGNNLQKNDTDANINSEPITFELTENVEDNVEEAKQIEVLHLTSVVPEESRTQENVEETVDQPNE